MNPLSQRTSRWRPLLSPQAYDQSPALSRQEFEAIAQRLGSPHKYKLPRSFHEAVGRLLRPIHDVACACGYGEVTERLARVVLLEAMYAKQCSFFAFTEAQWLDVLQAPCPYGRNPRLMLAVVAYLLCGFRAIAQLPLLKYTTMARRVFGSRLVDEENTRICTQLEALGYETARKAAWHKAAGCVSYLMLLNESPYLEEMTTALLIAAREMPTLAPDLHRVSQALVMLGILEQSYVRRTYSQWRDRTCEGISEEWVYWCRRWRETTTAQPRTTESIYRIVLRVGLWLASKHPEVTEPAHWTRALCLDFLAAVNDLKVGDWVIDRRYICHVVGKPITPATKDSFISAVRTFLRDLQRWGWIPIRFNTTYELKTPRSIAKLLGPHPRDIEEKHWLKLVWASLHLQQEDVPENRRTGSRMYPLEMVRAVAVVWTHAGLRADEITRLRLGCIRAQQEDLVDEQRGTRIPAGTLCYLEVPASKTYTAFTKPVPGVVGEVIAAWEHQRPEQPPALDRKTGTMESFLFSVRGACISGSTYLNKTIIPMLCKKAGTPGADARGKITSHRGRASAVTLLAKTQGGMSLLDLMKWCGHNSPRTTMHYVGVRPTKLAKSFARADKTSRMIEVLIDQEAVLEGTAAAGALWKYYDLGSSYCTHVFWSQCPHRLACAGCGFNVPKTSAKGEAIAAKAFLQRYLEEVPLTEEEREAVEGDLEKFKRMLARLEDVPAPDGRTPQQLRDQEAADAEARRA